MVSVENRKGLSIVDAEIEGDPQQEPPELVLSPDTHSTNPFQWLAHQIKKIMPRRLYARSILIIVAPVVITQCIITYIFFEQHWNTVTRRLAESVAGDIAFVIEMYKTLPDSNAFDALDQTTLRTTSLDIAIMPNQTLPNTEKSSFFSALDRTLRDELAKRVEQPFWFDTTRYPQYVDIRIQLDDDVLRIIAQRERVFAPSGPIFMLWMVGTSFVLLTIAILFLRNQVRPIQNLSEAATRFGKGLETSNFKPYGATEVRQASEAFMEMRDRITRQIEQRTLLLAGVSHDLRTPITRMKLQTALMPHTEELDDLRKDIEEMEHMLEEYLAFARGQGSEAAARTDIGEILQELCDNAKRSGFDVALDLRDSIILSVRRNAIKRCLTNLVDNALRYGDKIAIIAKRIDDVIEIAVDDDGPGIPADKRADVFKPFKRLDESRNLDEGGVGLGLAIAQDVAHGHGGEIELETSPWGGLRATLRLPV